MEMLLEKDTYETVKKYLPTTEEIGVLADFYALVADGTRLRIISALSISKMCVSDLVALLGINQTTCSHQLKQLKLTKQVESERCGKLIFYYLKNPAICDILLDTVKYLRL